MRVSPPAPPTLERCPASANSKVARSPQERLILSIAILASFVAFLDMSVVTVALPSIVEDLGGGLTTQQWTVDAYLLTLGSLILVAGSVSDAFGRQRVLRYGLMLFGVASVIIAAAPSSEVLIAARLLQGVAGAMLVPSSLALITSTFTGAERGRAIGTWTAVTSGAMVAGPLLGGLSVDLASWRLAFLINVLPIAVALVLLARVEARDVRRDDARVDLVSACLAALGLAGAVFALIEQPNLGWSAPSVWGSGLAGVLVFAWFVLRQARIAQPMLPLSLFQARNFAWGNLSTFLVYGALGLNRLRGVGVPPGACGVLGNCGGAVDHADHARPDGAELARGCFGGAGGSATVHDVGSAGDGGRHADAADGVGRFRLLDTVVARRGGVWCGARGDGVAAHRRRAGCGGPFAAPASAPQ